MEGGRVGEGAEGAEEGVAWWWSVWVECGLGVWWELRSRRREPTRGEDIRTLDFVEGLAEYSTENRDVVHSRRSMMSRYEKAL